MTHNTELVTSLLEAKGYVAEEEQKRKVFKKVTHDGYLTKVIIQKGSNTIFIYDCQLNGSPISFIEIHNYTNSRQMENLYKLV